VQARRAAEVKSAADTRFGGLFAQAVQVRFGRFGRRSKGKTRVGWRDFGSYMPLVAASQVFFRWRTTKNIYYLSASSHPKCPGGGAGRHAPKRAALSI
jgi:hypothetical protein